LIELAEALQAPVIDQASRMNFPTMHPFNHSARGAGTGFRRRCDSGIGGHRLLGRVHSYRDQLERSSQSIIDEKTKLISITANDLYVKGNYQDFQRYRN